MEYEKYTIERDNIKNILGYIESGQIAIPELQRPFVWETNQITKLIDSLYKGLPTGFIVVWANDKVTLKDGTQSFGKKIIIDGQQRITALRAVLLGESIITEDYSSRKFIVSYDPFSEKFETYKPIHDKSSKWIKDISIFFKQGGLSETLKFVKEYVSKNSNITEEELLKRIDKVRNIVQREIGVINLSQKLSIAEATNIFNLMNREGTRLGQEDYIMAKLSSDIKYDGYYIWKTIDYFCKGMHDKKYIEEIPTKDSDFLNTEYYNAIKWILNYNSNIYVPTYNDMLRVSYGVMFKNGILKRFSDLLDGRNFEEKTLEENIAKDTFNKLKTGLLSFVNQHNFKQFNLYMESVGVKYKKLVNSQSALNSSYVIYLLLKSDKNIKKTEICSYVQKWYILSVLTRRYSSSSETVLDQDLKGIKEKGFIEYFKEIESSLLNSEFWNTVLIHDLETSYTLSPSFLIYTAAQIKNNVKSLFSESITIDSILKIKGDVHHLFPKGYLKINNIKEQKYINQVCNYAYIDTNSNIDIGDDAPKTYFNDILNKSTKNNTFGLVKSKEDFYNSLKENCIPSAILNYDFNNYEEFLKERRILIAEYIKKYYESL